MSRGAGQRRAVRALEPPERARRVDGDELLAARRLRVAVHVDDLVDRAGATASRPFTSADHLVSPAATARGPRGRARRARSRRGEVRAGVERVAELLEEDRLLDEAEADAALVLAHRHAEPAELGKLRPAVVLRRVPVAVERVALGEPRARLRASARAGSSLKAKSI